MKFQFGGPKRYEHQRRALRKIIETRGVCALLLEPGLGKTAVVLDYLSLLALKSREEVGGVPEVRALIISPKVAVDNWVLQAETYVSPQVDVWAEALGGSIVQKCETLISRGPDPYAPKTVRRARDRQQLPYRGLNMDKAEMIYTRADFGPRRGVTDVRSRSEEIRPRLVISSVNLDMFSSRARRGSGTMADYVVQAVRKYRPHVIVIDESHRIKGVGSNVSRLAARLSKLTPRRLLLTGTVMPHGPMDVFAQWRFLEPFAFGDLDPRTKKPREATFTRFQRRYGIMGGFMGREVIAFQNLDELQEIMARNSIVVRKEDALDLPEATPAVVPVVLSSKEQKAYDEMKKNLATSIGAGQLTAANRLTQMLRLRQITAGYMPDDTGAIHTLGESKISAIEGIAHDILVGEKRIVVFAVFRHEIEMLKKALSRSGTEVLTIDGNTPQEQRLAIRQRFGSKDPARIILVAQVQTISLSVNELITASNAIYATLSQRRDDLVQSKDRLNRIGQMRKMTFWFPLARGTIDEVVYRSHEERTSLEAAILAHVQDGS